MQNREECIYNLIPKPAPEPIKKERYKSKHDPNLAPTGSTFGCKGKTIIEGSNLGVSQDTNKEKQGTHSFGKVLGKSNPKEFLKKKEKSDTSNNVAKFSYPGARIASVPSSKDKPIMGLKSNKDFVTANAVDSILAVPGNRSRVQSLPPEYKKKVDYGKVPSYLKEVKKEIQEENKMIERFVRQNQNLREEDEVSGEVMDSREQQELINALKTKWDHVNHRYQKMCHLVVFDTQGKVRRKEQLEAELQQIEKDIEFLEKGNVVVAKNS